MSEPNRREEELFIAALDISDPLQRAAYLKGACGNDAALHAQLLELLAAHDASKGPLDRSPAASLQSPTVAQQVSTLAGTKIAGKYKLVDPIGEGGMGSVWLAEQREPVKRLVAIKLIKVGMDSKAVLARFEAER